MMTFKQFKTISLISSAIICLSGCAAMNTAITHRNLDTQTKMSQTVFLKPVPKSKKTVYLDVHNASDKQLSLIPDLRSSIEGKGYRVVNRMRRAHYLLQVNVLKIGKLSQTAAQNALLGGYGGALSGATVGAATAAVATDSGAAVIGGGLIGGLVGTVADDLVKDTTFSMITDVQISERLPKGEIAKSSTLARVQQGTATSEVTRLSKRSRWMQYRTRIVSTADKVNLHFSKAKPILESQLSNSISSIF